ncbi:MAG: DsbA family protein [Bacteroidota bacterium]
MNDNTSLHQQEDSITFKRSQFYSILVVLAFAVGVLVGYMAWGRGSGVASPVPAAANPTAGSQGVVEAPVATQQAQYVRYDVPTEGFPSLGPADAPITIVEFSDFQCPFCRRFYQETYKPLLDAYPGKIRFVYRDLPLTSIHPEAFPAAVAAACANEQDAYWPFHDKLFNSEQLGKDVYLQYASELKLDMTAFQECIASDRHNDAINKDADFAIKLGVNSTPTFFINGLAVVGAQPLSVFQQVIDKELAGEIPTK